MTKLFLVQRFKDDKWVTVTASTFEDDAIESFDALRFVNKLFLNRPTEAIRRATLEVTDLDFLMIYARNVTIVDSHNSGTLTPGSS